MRGSGKTDQYSYPIVLETLLISLAVTMTSLQSFQWIGRPIFALACIALLGSSVIQFVRERRLRDKATEAAPNELAQLRRWHLEFRIGMVLIAIISLIPG